MVRLPEQHWFARSKDSDIDKRIGEIRMRCAHRTGLIPLLEKQEERDQDRRVVSPTAPLQPAAARCDPSDRALIRRVKTGAFTWPCFARLRFIPEWRQFHDPRGKARP